MKTSLTSSLLLTFLTTLFTLWVIQNLGAQMSETQYADDWSDPSGVPNWTPLPNDGQVLGPPDDKCTGTANGGIIRAIFDFPAFTMVANPVLGIEVVVRYRSVVACEMQLMNGGTLIGATRTLPSTPADGNSSCNASLLRIAGANNDRWGTTLSSTDFASGNIRVRLTRVGGESGPSIDIESVGMKVYYGNRDPDCSGAMIATQSVNANCQAPISGANVTGITDTDGDPLTITVNPTTLSLGSNTVTISADDGNGGSCTKMITVNAVDNTNPAISCPSMVMKSTDPDQCGAVVSFSVTGTDNCGTPTISCNPASGAFFPVGTTQVKCKATDGSGNIDECSFNVVVKDTQDPSIDCSGINPNRTTDPGVCSFTMPGTGFDPTFSDNCPGYSIKNDYNNSASLAGATFPEGSTPVTWTATDQAGNTSQCAITIVITDDESPVINTISESISLWPPNHQYHTILVEDCVISVSDNCDLDLTASDVFITRVTSDEPEDAPGNGDGKTFQDIVISSDCSRVDLRSERQGGGNGRVYTVHLSVFDYTGNEGTATCQITVDHDKNGPLAVNNGVAYQVNGSCSSPKLAGPVINLMQEQTPVHYLNTQSYPNPFSLSTSITITLDKTSEIGGTVYNLQGQLIQTLHTGILTAGVHNFSWQGTDAAGRKVPAGVYIYQLRGPDFVETQKLMYIN